VGLYCFSRLFPFSFSFSFSFFFSFLQLLLILKKKIFKFYFIGMRINEVERIAKEHLVPFLLSQTRLFHFFLKKKKSKLKKKSKFKTNYF